MNPKLYCFACMSRLETEDARCPVCGHDNRVRVNGKGLLPFSIIKNRYLIGKALGRGGFGVTYIGMDLSLERRVAIKEYYPTDLVSRESGQSALTPHDEDTRARFEQGRERSKQEARTIASLNDVPDAVNVHDVFLANDTLYIVMEYIQGETLRARVLREGGRIPPETLLALLKPVFAALTQIHRQGILHRDVSPDNIMFRATNGRPVLLDFGAAHSMQPDAESEHSTSLRPGYAPVEQYSRKGLQDARTDEYALCATMYFALTG
ncbi:MAG: serine/threonine protein kinase, partial [Clostridiales bacterium]|nr:serine/threonine protein kinase [Clostridiales bacterium]